jgi:hypothetical protein
VFREYFESGKVAYLKNGKVAAHSIELPATPYFLTNDKVVLDKFINKLNQYAVSLDWFRMNIDRALVQNRALDSLIRKEYELEGN